MRRERRAVIALTQSHRGVMATTIISPAATGVTFGMGTCGSPLTITSTGTVINGADSVAV
jgi:hypothetical protein